jgi:tetratricopeptide (TPR) repeat protein
VIQLDPQYAAGWYQLGVRYYDDVNYGSGDDAEYQRAIEYHERAVALDPDFLQAQRGLAITKAESHQPTAAWAQARLLLRKWPNDSDSDSHLPCHTFCDIWAYPKNLPRNAKPPFVPIPPIFSFAPVACPICKWAIGSGPQNSCSSSIPVQPLPDG